MLVCVFRANKDAILETIFKCYTAHELQTCLYVVVFRYFKNSSWQLFCRQLTAKIS